MYPTHPWIHAGVQTATEDPYILSTYGELVSRVRALGAAAKVVATQVALDTTSRVFEVTGARSAKRSVGLDRYWRNARTETLHSPVAYKIEEVGRLFLNDTLAKPSDYR